MSISTFLIVAAVISTTLLVLNRRAFSRILHLGKSQAGNLGRAAEQVDPVSQMREAADAAKDQVAAARDALVKSKALKDSLERQVSTNNVEIARFKAKLEKYKQEGRTKTDPEVVKVAEKLARAINTLKTNEQQLEIQNNLYNTTLESAKKAAAKIAGIEQDANNLEVRLETSNSQAELAEAFNSYNPSGINNAVNKASRFASIAEQQIAANNAKLQVNADLGIASEEEDDAEISLAASSILDDFDK